MAKVAASRQTVGYIIINPTNGIWHRGVFDTEKEAEEFIRETYRGNIPEGFSIGYGELIVNELYDKVPYKSRKPIAT